MRNPLFLRILCFGAQKSACSGPLEPTPSSQRILAIARLEKPGDSGATAALQARRD
jgi:hypothetical protein